MIILIILAHPDRGSFNHAIATVAKDTFVNKGHEVILHDLYDEHFNPIMPAQEIPSNASLPDVIASHCRDIISADGIIIVHPNWWGQPPAILKGWVDRVIRPGVAYEFEEGDEGEGIPNGLLKGKRIIVFNTSNTPAIREKEVFGDPLEILWNNCIFDLCGVKSFYRRMFNVVVTSTKEERKEWLKEVQEIINKSFATQKTA